MAGAIRPGEVAGGGFQLAFFAVKIFPHACRKLNVALPGILLLGLEFLGPGNEELSSGTLSGIIDCEAGPKKPAGVQARPAVT